MGVMGPQGRASSDQHYAGAQLSNPEHPQPWGPCRLTPSMRVRCQALGGMLPARSGSPQDTDLPLPKALRSFPKRPTPGH